MIRIGDMEIHGDTFREAASLLEEVSRLYQVAGAACDEGDSANTVAALKAAGDRCSAAFGIVTTNLGIPAMVRETDGGFVLAIAKPDGGISDGEPG